MLDRKRLVVIVAAGGLLSLVIGTGSESAQRVRYLARAVATIDPQGNTEDEALAGGVDDDNPCGRTANAFCGIDETLCFEVPEAAGSCGDSTVMGGARNADADTDQPGFPWAVAETSGASTRIAVGPLNLIEIVASNTRVVVDALTGAVDTECSCDRIRILGQGAEPGQCPEEGATVNPTPIPIPLLGLDSFVLPCVLIPINRDGLVGATVIGAVVVEANGNRTELSRSTAAVEIPFTSGGAGCSTTGSQRGTGGVLIAALVLLLTRLGPRRRYERTGTANGRE